MITKQLIEHIEGEASVYFDIQEGRVASSTVVFPHFRGMESLLQGKNALDALVITPRVCGICGHAHLMAAVRAIEDAYKNAGHTIKLSSKAQKIREFTLIMEMLQNHFKWLYMVILPELAKLSGSKQKQMPLKGAFASALSSKAIAIFGGQWPHSSYMVPGGVTCDPTYLELLQAKNHLSELIRFFEKETIGTPLEDFLAMQSCKDLNVLYSDITALEKGLIETQMHKKGMAHDKFLIIGEHSFSIPSKLRQTRALKVDSRYVTTEKAFTPQSQSYAKNALYKDEYFETGPLARMMSLSLPIIKNMHRRYKDSAYTRIMARVFELAYMLDYSKNILETISLDENSVVTTYDIDKISGEGVGVVEAPRGPLLHRVKIEEGIIQTYEIITPTQFNIGSSIKEKPTPVQKAMQGRTKAEALFIFRTFDVCSVCTTH